MFLLSITYIAYSFYVSKTTSGWELLNSFNIFASYWLFFNPCAKNNTTDISSNVKFAISEVTTPILYPQSILDLEF